MNPNFLIALPATGWTQECALCGAEIKDGDEEIEVETQWHDQGGSSWPFRRVWHKPCHLQHLDEGEET